MYHEVEAVDCHSSYFGVSADAFNAHLDVIGDLGVGCTIAGAFSQPETPCVAISFDDGTVGQYLRAFPALVSHGMTATFFVTTSWVGRPGFVTWDHLREMKDDGMSIQSHTHSHPFLSRLSRDTLTKELYQSKAVLDQQLQQDTTAIALPGGDAPATKLWDLFAESGYEVVATSRCSLNGPSANVYPPATVFRCTVRGDPRPSYVARLARGDRATVVRRRIREEILGGVRRGLGTDRYARLRKHVIEAFRGKKS